MKIYKIFNTKSKLYSKGGMATVYDDYRYWSKKGKVWNGLGPLKNHFNLFKEHNIPIPPEWQVHEFELREELTKVMWPGYVMQKL